MLVCKRISGSDSFASKMQLCFVLLNYYMVLSLTTEKTLLQLLSLKDYWDKSLKKIVLLLTK